jgi:hypothetical protein
LRIWNLQTGVSRVLKGHTDSVNAVAVTPDGRRAISGSWDNTLRIWDLKTGVSRVLKGHTYGVTAVAVTNDGQLAISGSRDHTLRVWNLETDETVAIYRSAVGGTKSTVFRYDAGGVLSVAQRFPMLIAGTSSGNVKLLCLVDRTGVPLVLQGPRISTLTRLWLCAPGVTGGRWDEVLSATCEMCGQRFPASAAIIDTIDAITHNAHLGPDDSPCDVLPSEAWSEPGLLSECPLCRTPLKFNPFVVDYLKRCILPKRWWKVF